MLSRESGAPFFAYRLRKESHASSCDLSSVVFSLLAVVACCNVKYFPRNIARFLSFVKRSASSGVSASTASSFVVIGSAGVGKSFSSCRSNSRHFSSPLISGPSAIANSAFIKVSRKTSRLDNHNSCASICLVRCLMELAKASP